MGKYIIGITTSLSSLKLTMKNFQEEGKAIRFSILLIWIAIVKTSPVDEVFFTSTSTLAINHFKCFSPMDKTTRPTKPKEILDKWLQMVKSTSNKWRSPKNIQHDFPPNYQIEMGLNHTKISYEHGFVTQLANLDYVPLVDTLFKDLIRKSNTIYLFLTFQEEMSKICSSLSPTVKSMTNLKNDYTWGHSS